MIREIGAFFLVWAAWSFFDQVLLRWHPWAEAVVFATGIVLVVPWSDIVGTRARLQRAEEILSRI